MRGLAACRIRGDETGVATTLQRTPLYAVHLAAGARMVPFAGWEMPVQYAGVIAEHQAVRTAVGLFDISHMGILDFGGSGVAAFLDYVLTNRVDDLRENQVRYSLVCRTDGGILDDVLVYRLPTHYRLVVNAANTDKIVRHLESHAHGNHWNVRTTVRNADLALLAVQGPQAVTLLDTLVADTSLAGVRYYWGTQGRFLGEVITLTRTGYTGEDGFELFVPAERAVAVWETLREAGEPYGLQPAGLGARDTLRLEMGYPLYGNDMDETTTPVEASLERAVDFKKGDFIGKEAILRKKEKGIERKLVGFELLQKGIPRHGYRIYSNGKTLGAVTSGNFSPTLKKGIGLGFVHPTYSGPGSEILIDIRGKVALAVVVELPFYKKVRRR